MCKSCGAEVIWATTWPKEQRMPCNAAGDAAGNVVLTHRPGQSPLATIINVSAEPWPSARQGRSFRTVSHFVTCAAADQHRQRGANQ